MSRQVEFTNMVDFKGSHYPKDVILYAVFFYVRYAVSYRDLEEIMAERRATVVHATLNRWVVKYSPLIEILQVKYLNNMIEQDHRFIKKLTRPTKGFKSFQSASATLNGIEVAHMIRKHQFPANGQSAFQQFAALAAQLRPAIAVSADRVPLSGEAWAVAVPSGQSRESISLPLAG